MSVYIDKYIVPMYVCVCSIMSSVHLPYKAVSSMRGLPKGPVCVLVLLTPT